MKDRETKKKPECETFTEANFQDEVEGSEMPVLAVFEADWSGTCHIMTPILEDLCSEFKGRVKIGMIDIDSNVKLAESYWVTKIPSLLFFNNGEIVDHLTGSVPKNEIATRLTGMASASDK